MEDKDLVDLPFRAPKKLLEELELIAEYYSITSADVLRRCIKLGKGVIAADVSGRGRFLFEDYNSKTICQIDPFEHQETTDKVIYLADFLARRTKKS